MNLPSAVPAPPSQTPRADAARYAVLRRVAPKLRHDVAGAMQPIGMILMVLQRRLQAAEPDLQAITKNVASIDALMKEATAGSMSAMGWLAPREDPLIDLATGVDDIVRLLSVELSASGIEAVSDIDGGGSTQPLRPLAPQSFFRSVLAGALLAFCDDAAAGADEAASTDTAGAATLHISLESASDGGGEASLRLMLRRTAGTSTSVDPSPLPRSFPVGWDDVAALAASHGLRMTRGEGWAAIGLPQEAQASQPNPLQASVAHSR